MDEIEVESVADVELEDPVLLEGLPGVGHVGKLVAEHLIEERDSTLVSRIYSEHMPPQVTIDGEGEVQLASVELHAVKGDRDLLVLVGDHQPQDSVGQYRMTEAVLDLAADAGVTESIALGGVPTGELVEQYTVIGAVTSADLKADLESAGVEFGGDDPEGGIIGTSGLLLGLGKRRDLPATCLMGETSGYLVDPKSARAVLEVVQSILSLDIDFTRLEDRAEEMEEMVEGLAEQQQQKEENVVTPTEENLRYIG